MADPNPAKDFVLVIDTKTKKKSRVPANYLKLFPHLKPAHEQRAATPNQPVAEPKAAPAVTYKKEG